MKLPTNVQSRLSDMARTAQSSGETVSLQQLRDVANEFSVDLDSVHDAFAAQMKALDQGAAAMEDAGARSSQLRDAAGGGGAFQGQGAANAATTPALQGFNLKVPGEDEPIVTQQQMNAEAGAKLDEAIGFRDEQIGRLLAQWDGVSPEDIGDLEKASEAFDSFMEAEATFAGNLEARGGSLMPLIYAGEAKRMVETQTQALRTLADEGFLDYGSSAAVPDDASQLEMNMLASEAAHGKHEKMESLVEQLKGHLADDPEALVELDTAQAAFLGFRDAQATLAGNVEARGGSLFGLVYASASEALTDQRIAQLEQRLEMFGGAVVDEPIVSQAQMNQQAGTRLDQAIGFRDEQIGRLLKQWDTSDPENIADLEKSSEAFDKFMQADATFVGNAEARGGSMMPLIFSGVAEGLVSRQTAALRKLADDGHFDYAGTAQVPDDAPQLAMNQAAYAAADKANAEMEGLVAELKTLLSYDPESLTELDAAQEAFVEFRETQSTLAGNVEARGGSLAGLIYGTTSEGMTRERIADLQQRIDDLSDR